MDRDLFRLINEFERAFNTNFSSTHPIKKVDNGVDISKYPTKPTTNVYEDEWVYEYVLSTPGLTKEDIKIDINENKLYFSGEKTVDSEKKGNNIFREFYYTRFNRNFDIPENVVSDEIYAKVENGLTTIYLPKEKPTKKKTTKRSVEII
jgi:HSP20 family protein